MGAAPRRLGAAAGALAICGLSPALLAAHSRPGWQPQSLRAEHVEAAAPPPAPELEASAWSLRAHGRVVASGQHLGADGRKTRWLLCGDRLEAGTAQHADSWQLAGDVRLRLGQTLAWAGRATFEPEQGSWQLEGDVVTCGPHAQLTAERLRLAADGRRLSASQVHATALAQDAASRALGAAAGGVDQDSPDSWRRCPLPPRPAAAGRGAG